MLYKFFATLLAAPVLFSSIASATGATIDTTQLGPSTPLSAKATICNILDYGGMADNATDVAAAIKSAFSSCASKGGATLYIPPGNYLLKTGVTLNKANKFALRIDGLITLASDGSFSGNAFIIENSSDVEVYSSNGLGAINGQGYITRVTKSGQNARLFRFITCTNISFHDMILVDSPTFHLIFNGVTNMEAYHITIRGPSVGGTDGIDVACNSNCHIHHVEVTNRDECISVKSPSKNLLMEEIYCNQSGGMSIGSLTANGVTSSTEAQVEDITMRNIYVHQCTQMLMIKTFPGGSGATGYVKNGLFENFWAYDTTYGLDIDQYWQTTTTPDTGAVALSDLTFRNWTGTVDNGVSRAPVVIRGSDQVPITGVELDSIVMWTVNGGKLLQKCKNAYGTGLCLRSPAAGQALTTYTTTQTTTATPAGYIPPASPKWGIPGYGTGLPIPVYTPAVMWAVGSSSSSVAAAPTTSSKVVVTTSAAASTTPKSTTVPASTSTPKSTSNSSSKSSSAVATPSSKTTLTTSTVVKTTTTAPATSSSKAPSATAPAAGVTVTHYGQCGGVGYTGSIVCAFPYTCVVANEWYSQCL